MADPCEKLLHKVEASITLASSQDLSILRNQLTQLIAKYDMPVRLILVHRAKGTQYLSLRPKSGFVMTLPEGFYTELSKFSYQRHISFSMNVIFRNEIPQIKIELE